MLGFVILILVLGFLALFVPILFKVLDQTSTNKSLDRRLAALEAELKELRYPRGPIPPPVLAAAPPVLPASAPAPASAVPPLPVRPRLPAQGPHPPPIAPRPTVNWEQFMGVKMFAWLGGLALLLGVAFFVKYSFEHNLIPPEVRVAIGFVVGAALIVGGLAVPRQRYAITAQTLCAAGVVSLYAVAFACNSVYKFAFFGAVPTFFLMAFITAIGFFLAVRLEAKVIAVLGFLAGFLTPVLLSTGVDHPFELFGYLTLLDLGLIAIALARSWPFLVPLGAGGTILMQLAWAGNYFAPSKAATAVAVCLGFCGLFLLGREAAARVGRSRPEITFSAIAFPFVAFGFASWFLSYPALAARPGLLFTLVFLADAALLILCWRDKLLPHLHAVGGLCVFALLAAWTATALTDALLPWALGLYLIQAVLHTSFPVIRGRRHPPLAKGVFGDGSAQVPSLSAVLPFLLLMILTTKLRLADPSPIFGLAFLLAVLGLGLAALNAIEWLPACALAGVGALEYVWRANGVESQPMTVPLVWYLGFAALFEAYPFLFRRRFSGIVGPWAVAALAGVVQFPLVYRLVITAWPNRIHGLIPALFALPALLSLIAVRRTIEDGNPRKLTQLAWFAGVSLFFITLIFPIQFERQWITIGWALEGAALTWLFHRIPHPGLRAIGTALLVAAFARLALNPAVLEYHPRGDNPFLNWYWYGYGAVAASLFAGAWLLGNPRDRVFGLRAPPLLRALAVVTLFLLLNLEITDYFAEPGSFVPLLDFSGSFARDMTYTIAWALFALCLLLVGLQKETKAGRYAAVGLLSATLLKLFFHDLSQLGSLYRVGAFFAVAAIAIIASFAYQRLLPRRDGVARPRT